MRETRHISCVQVCIYIMFVIVAVVADQEDCDKTKCPGPLMYYETLRCTPVYKNEGDCCAIRYNCDHLKERSANKCYINNNEYEIGEILKEEDMNPCDTACTCIKGQNDNEVAAFECRCALCSFSITEQPGCYLVRNWSLCCGFEEICPENPEDRDNTCIVNGETYKNGEIFIIEGEPKMICICQPGYQGENVPPFCHYSKHVYWDPAFDHANNIRQNCVPIFISDSEDFKSYRCQDINDVVVRKHNNLNASENLDEENVCVFGNLTMRIGDKLNTGTNLFKLCVKCICEVPPLLTCQHVSSCWRMLTKD
ncbi:hypothetical protein P5V15_013500 [Pogonomyrmex californicus]